MLITLQLNILQNEQCHEILVRSVKVLTTALYLQRKDSTSAYVGAPSWAQVGIGDIVDSILACIGTVSGIMLQYHVTSETDFKTQYGNHLDSAPFLDYPWRTREHPE